MRQDEHLVKQEDANERYIKSKEKIEAEGVACSEDTCKRDEEYIKDRTRSEGRRGKI